MSTRRYVPPVLLAILLSSASPVAAGVAEMFHSEINEFRESLGLSPLKWSPSLARLAEQHAARMGETDELYHERCQEYNFENVVRVPNTGEPTLTARLLAITVLSSPPHRWNVLEGNCEGVGVSISGAYAVLSQKISRASDDAVDVRVDVPPFHGEVSTAHRDNVEEAVLDAINREREQSGLPPLVLDEELSKRVLEELREAVKTLSVTCSSRTLVILTRLQNPAEIAEDVLGVLRAVPAGRNLWVPKGRLGVAALEVTEVTLPDGNRLELGVVWVGIDVVEEAAEKNRPRRVPFPSYVTIAIPLCYLIARRQTFFTGRPQR